MRTDTARLRAELLRRLDADLVRVETSLCATATDPHLASEFVAGARRAGIVTIDLMLEALQRQPDLAEFLKDFIGTQPHGD